MFGRFAEKIDQLVTDLKEKLPSIARTQDKIDKTMKAYKEREERLLIPS